MPTQPNPAIEGVHLAHIYITVRTTGQRQRLLDRWSIETVRDNEGSWTRAKGITVKGAGEDLTGFVRFTTTSAIQSREGMTLTTSSGSTYTLLEPADANQIDNLDVLL